MVQVGNVGLTPEEQKSHFSLWAIMSAPLLAGTDIEHASAATLAILTAPEVRKTPSWPKSWPTAAFYSCIPIGMPGPTCMFWANLTPFSLEIVALNQDLGVGGKLQGKYLGSALGPDDANAAIQGGNTSAIAIKCDGKPDQKWDFVLPTGEVLDEKPPFDTPLHIRHRSTGRLLDVPDCARAAEPFGPGPRIQCGTGGGSTCGGKNQLWQVGY